MLHDFLKILFRTQSGSLLPGMGKSVSGSSLSDHFTPQQPRMTKVLSGSSLSPIENLPPSAQLGTVLRIEHARFLALNKDLEDVDANLN